MFGEYYVILKVRLFKAECTATMAAKAETNSDLDEILTCSVCLEILKQPYTLKECLHSFCKPCLDSLNRKVIENEKGVECPLCWTFTGEDSIKSNFFIGSLLDAHEKAKGSNKLECGCMTKAEPMYRCTHCKMNLCEKCKESHSLFPLLQNHKIVPLEEYTEIVVDKLVFCQIHHDEPVKFNCKDCEVLLCITCKVIDHESHKTETVETALDRLLPEIMGNKDKIESNVDEMKQEVQKIEEKVAETKDAYSATCMEIKDKADELIKMIQENEKQLLKQVTTKEEEQLSKLENIKTNLEHRIKTSQNLRSLVNASITNARHTSLLSEFQGGLYQMVKTYSTPTEKTTLKMDYPRFNFASVAQDVLGKVIYQSQMCLFGHGKDKIINYRDISEDMREFFTTKTWHKVKEINIASSCNRMAKVNGNIWFPCYTTSNIQVYNSDGIKLNTIFLKDKRPKALVEISEDAIVLACEVTGLFEITKEGHITKQIAEGTFCDVIGADKNVFALEFKNHKVHKFEIDNQGVLQPSQVFHVHGLSDSPHSTILLSGNKLFISSYWKKTILIVSIEGHQLQSSITTSDMFLCASDSKGLIYLAAYYDKCIYAWNGVNEWTKIQCAEGQKFPVDLIKDSDNSIWVLSLNNATVKYM